VKTIAVDFDGVIHRYSKGWHDGTIYDKPEPGAKEALTLLMRDFEVFIYSTRCYDRVIEGETQKNQVEEMRQWLDTHQIPYTRIHTDPGKPHCKLFIDDNALRYRGNWADTWSQAVMLLGDDK
jgi:hypothetical protein